MRTTSSTDEQRIYRADLAFDYNGEAVGWFGCGPYNSLQATKGAVTRLAKRAARQGNPVVRVRYQQADVKWTDVTE